jgi:hypothetical protein
MGAGAIARLSPEELAVWQKMDTDISSILDPLRYTKFEENKKGCHLLSACPLQDIIAVLEKTGDHVRFTDKEFHGARAINDVEDACYHISDCDMVHISETKYKDSVLGLTGQALLKQGNIGNCWLAAAYNSLFGLRPDILETGLFMDCNGMSAEELGKRYGIYCLKFFVQPVWGGPGEWTYVVIDDTILIRSESLFSWSVVGASADLWAPLLEKACAKAFYSAYAELKNGTIGGNRIGSTAPRTLWHWNASLGGVGKSPTYDWDGGLNNAKDKSPRMLWKILLLLSDKRIPAVTSCSVDGIKEPGQRLFLQAAKVLDSDGGSQTLENFGLVLNHDYGYLGTFDGRSLGGDCLVKLVNPWRQHEYSGPWSDSSLLWTDELKKAANLVSCDDGVFYIDIRTFHDLFGHMEMCLLETEVPLDIFDYNDESFVNAWGGSNHYDSTDAVADAEFDESLPMRPASI